MSRCKACDHILTLVDYTIRPRELTAVVPEDIEEDLCVRCLGISFFEYSFTADHTYLFQEAISGATEPIPTLD